VGFEKKYQLPMQNRKIQSTLHWLQRSIAVHGGRGSAGYYHLWRGWSAAYPETTGYLIETLWDYYHTTGDETLRRDAISCTDWLADMQHPDGAWPGGVGGTLPPIVFDTGMILFGMTRSFAETGETRYWESARRGLHWLLDMLDADGIWRKAAYEPGYTPRYYTCVVWAVLYANRYVRLPGVEERMRVALQAMVSLEGAPSLSPLRAGEPALTHTIAYEWRGTLESALLLGDDTGVERAAAFGHWVVAQRAGHQGLAGAYDETGKGDHSFSCVTGNAQLSALLRRLHYTTGEPAFRQTAKRLYEDAEAAVWQRGLPGMRGGVPGSQPVWGKYQSYRFLNWAAKFFLDAGLN
jgi:hypothetical protein